MISLKNSFLSRCLDSNKNNFGKQSYIIYIVIYFLLSILLLNKILYFPDYSNYNQYIINGTAIVRFISEPISALFMNLLYQLNFGAKEYYTATWIISSIIVFIIPIVYGKRYFIFSIFLLLNPITIILFQTPRQFLAYAIFILGIFIISKSKFLILILILLTHTITGLLAIFLFFLSSIKRKYAIYILFLGLLVLLYATTGAYSRYSHSGEIQRGMGRLFLFLVYGIIILFLGYRKNKLDLLLISSILAFVVISYKITPYTGRILIMFLPILTLYLFNTFIKRDSFIVIHMLFLSYLSLTFYILYFGGYGFG